ncbi:MAG: hypothetical protein JXQ75_05355 [Phycisphaerae bacterium]|nr:hypothetical protein [Phycisphaerae bacterium]
MSNREPYSAALSFGPQSPVSNTAFHRKRDYDCWTENPFSVLKPVPRKDPRQNVQSFYW